MIVAEPERGDDKRSETSRSPAVVTTACSCGARTRRHALGSLATGRLNPQRNLHRQSSGNSDMRVLGSRQFAMLTLGMSLPLLFSFQLRAPPEFLQGLPFIMVWTWSVVSAITVPVLAALEIVTCVFHRRHRNQSEAALPFHATAIRSCDRCRNRVLVLEKKRSAAARPSLVP
jgi:hypothetical protein